MKTKLFPCIENYRRRDADVLSNRRALHG